MPALEHSDCHRHAILALDGEIDLVSAVAVRAKLAAIIEQTRHQRVVVDLRDVTFMDSSGIGALLSAYRPLRLQQRELLVADPQPIVARVLAIANFERIVAIVDSLADAVDHCEHVHAGASLDRT